MKLLLKKASYIITLLLVFLFPVFFSPLTQEYYSFNKFFLLVYGSIILVVVYFVHLLFTKKIFVRFSIYEKLLTLLLLFTTLSVLFSSTNKISSLLSTINSPILYFALLVFFMAISRKKVKSLSILLYSACLVALITIASFLKLFSFIPQTSQWSFLNLSQFTPLGLQLDHIIFLSICTLLGVGIFFINLFKQKQSSFSSWIIGTVIAAILLIGIIISSYTFITNKYYAQLTFSPFSISWYTSIDTLKNPKTALFGVGVDNYLAAFTQSKPADYNLTNLWNNNFRYARNIFFHSATETGIITGLLMLIIILIGLHSIYKQARIKNEYSLHSKLIFITFSALSLCLFFFPPSLPLLFLFIVLLAEIRKNEPEEQTNSISLEAFSYVTIILLLLVLITGSVVLYFGNRAYASEIAFKKALNAISRNDGKTAYDQERIAIQLNPYIERNRLAFSQFNLLLANNLSQKKELSDDDRKLITQLIQQAITESKAAIALNPQKATNWETLASIYRSVINIVSGADVWTIAAYQRAIILDPNNPLLRLSLGGVYYAGKDYENATKFFEQAVSLKPEYANFHYNLAWAYYNSGKYTQAVAQLENTLALYEIKDNEDYKRASKELTEFKKKAKDEQAKQIQPSTGGPDLQLQTPPNASVSPKLNLSDELAPPIEATDEAATIPQEE